MLNKDIKLYPAYVTLREKTQKRFVPRRNYPGKVVFIFCRFPAVRIIFTIYQYAKTEYEILFSYK